MTAPTMDHKSIVETVRRWPREAQLALAEEILRAAIASAPHGTEPPRGAWRDLIGILSTDQPPPSDEEIERMREEWRMEKYGN